MMADTLVFLNVHRHITNSSRNKLTVRNSLAAAGVICQPFKTNIYTGKRQTLLAIKPKAC
jgi:hypothetical protein